MITTFNILVYTFGASEVISFPVATEIGNCELDSYKNFFICHILWFIPSHHLPPFFIGADFCDIVYGHFLWSFLWWHQVVYLEILHSPL